MGEEKDWIYDDDDLLKTVHRYEEMVDKNAQYFFDVHEFEGIIDYYIDTDNFRKAVSVAEYAVHMYPESTVIQLKIAHLLIDRGKVSESMNILNRLELLEASNYEVFILKGTAYNMLGKVNEAEQQFNKAVSLTAGNRSEVLYNIGRTFEEQFQYKAAIRYFQEAFESDPDNFMIFYDLAYCYDCSNDLEKSAFYYDKFLDEDPFSDQAWFNLGNVYNRLSQNDKALDAYDFALAINPDYSSAFFNKGNILSNLEKYKEALEEYLEFLKLEENHVMALCYAGECFEKLRQTDDAVLYFQKAISLDPDCADAWFGLGVVKMNLARYDESIGHIKRALELSEENTEYLYALGLVYMRSNDVVNGLKIFEQVTELDPSDAEAWLNYSELFTMDHQLDKAIAVLQKAFDLNYKNPLINVRLGTYYFMKEDYKTGFQYLEKALAMDPSSSEDLVDFFPEALNNPDIKKTIEDYLKQNPD